MAEGRLMERFEDPFYGVVTLNDWATSEDGRNFKAVKGYMSVITDAQVGQGFRSSERWSLIIWASRDKSSIKVILPGCRVHCIVIISERPNLEIPNNGSLAVVHY